MSTSGILCSQSCTVELLVCARCGKCIVLLPAPCPSGERLLMKRSWCYENRMPKPRQCRHPSPYLTHRTMLCLFSRTCYSAHCHRSSTCRTTPSSRAHAVWAGLCRQRCGAAGKPPTRRGSQHRKTCEPAGHSYPGKGWTALEGPRVLTETPPGPYCRDLDAKPETPPLK